MGFEGPYAGGKHQIMQRGTQTIRVPNPHRADIGAKNCSESRDDSFTGRYLSGRNIALD